MASSSDTSDRNAIESSLCTTCFKLTTYSCISSPTMVCNKCSFSTTVRSLTVGSLENQLATADFATTKGKQQHHIARAMSPTPPQTSRKSYLPVPLSNILPLILTSGNSMHLFFSLNLNIADIPSLIGLTMFASTKL